MSQIIYGGDSLADPNAVTLAELRTQEISFEPVKSDDGMDYLPFTKVTFHVSGVVTPPIAPGVGVGETATTTLARIEHYLNKPRKAFQYSVPGQALVTWNGGPDARNGPHPQIVRVSQVDGAELYHVEFKIELNFNTCPTDPRFPLASHRWTERVTHDKRAYATWTRRGKIVTRGDMTANADELRGLVVPPVQPGFQRESSDIVLQSDGLALEYEFRDKEFDRAPAAPAWEVEGEYVETSNNGALRYGEVHVQLSGSKVTDKTKLLQTAIQIATDQLDNAAVQRGRDAALKTISAFRTKLWDNVVEVRVKAILQATRGRVRGLPVNLVRFIKHPTGSEPGRQAPDPGSRGTAGLKLIAAALNDPCLNQTVLRTSQPGVNQLATTGAVPEATVLVTAFIPDDQRALVAATGGKDDPLGFGIFTGYTMRVTDDEDPGVLVMGVGKKGAAPVSVQTSNPILTRVIEWRCERVGGPPQLPDSDMGSQWILTRRVISSDEVVPYGDGVSLVYAVAGQFRYTFSGGTIVRTLTAAVPPWVHADAKRLAAIASSGASLFIKDYLVDILGGSFLTAFNRNFENK